jgi:D-mannonate dehydratase
MHTAALAAAAQVRANPPRQSSAAQAKSKPALMKVGTQHGDSNEILRVLAAFGVSHICSRLPSVRLDEHWSVDGLSRLRERIESFGLTVDTVPLPMSSNYITQFELPNIMLGKSPERDREIDDVCQMIRNAARVGIPTLKYNMTFPGVIRTESTRGFVSIHENPYHGLNFCQGSVAEMLPNPGEEIYDVIRYFGSRGKIFNVHFRNISGGFLSFQETFIDDGSVDMLQAMRVYKEVGFNGMMMPDHVPKIQGDANSYQAFAFTFGYIKALIAAIAAET